MGTVFDSFVAQRLADWLRTLPNEGLDYSGDELNRRARELGYGTPTAADWEAARKRLHSSQAKSSAGKAFAASDASAPAEQAANALAAANERMQSSWKPKPTASTFAAADKAESLTPLFDSYVVKRVAEWLKTQPDLARARDEKLAQRIRHLGFGKLNAAEWKAARELARQGSGKSAPGSAFAAGSAAAHAEAALRAADERTFNAWRHP